MSRTEDFIVKDSGARREFESGMVRDTNDDKTLFHLVFSGPMFKRWAAHLTAGAKKYTADNWLKAEGEAELNRFRESAVRHFVQWLYGDRDEDHAAAVYFNINGAEYVRDRMQKDNLKRLLTEPSVLERAEVARQELAKYGPPVEIWSDPEGDTVVVSADLNIMHGHRGGMDPPIRKHVHKLADHGIDAARTAYLT